MGIVRRFYERRYERLTPEEKAAADAEGARRAEIAAAQIEAAHAAGAAGLASQEQSRIDHQAQLDAEVLGGPAGAAVHGTAAPPPGMLDQLKHTARAFTDVSAWLGVSAGFPTGIKDPVERARVQAGERAARDAGRRPYLAPQPHPATITRVPCRGATQHRDIARFLARSGLAAQPDLVFGTYRVPDRISPRTPTSEASRYVEWDVVHAPGIPVAPAEEPAVVRFDAATHWADRAYGEPAVLDEDLALAWLAGAGVPPEACLGITRDVVMEGGADLSDMGGGESEALGVARVTGVTVLHNAVLHNVAAVPAGKVSVPFDGVAGTHVEVLNWAQVRRVVHPRPQRDPETPSPFPYLPATPQEVLLAYLEVVGLRPADCFGAEVTIDELSSYGPVTSPNDDSLSMGDLGFGGYLASVCADGKSRTRLQCGALIVISYRDRPEYVDGRARWRAYQDDVLFARMHLKTGARRVIADEFEGVAGGAAMRAVTKVAGFLDKVTLSGEPDYFRMNLRYCQPLRR